MSRPIATVGLLLRQEFRRFLDRYDIPYREDRGWLDSQFIILDESDRTISILLAWKDRVKDDDD